MRGCMTAVSAEVEMFKTKFCILIRKITMRGLSTIMFNSIITNLCYSQILNPHIFLPLLGEKYSGYFVQHFHLSSEDKVLYFNQENNYTGFVYNYV